MPEEVDFGFSLLLLHLVFWACYMHGQGLDYQFFLRWWRLQWFLSGAGVSVLFAEVVVVMLPVVALAEAGTLFHLHPM